MRGCARWKRTSCVCRESATACSGTCAAVEGPKAERMRESEKKGGEKGGREEEVRVGRRRKRQRERDGKRERESVCVCEGVCVKERERERKKGQRKK